MFSCETTGDGHYGVFERIPCTEAVPSRFSDFISQEAFESYQVDHKSMESMGRLNRLLGDGAAGY